MKKRVTLSVKITILIIIASAVFGSAYLQVNLIDQKEYLQNSLFHHAITIGKTFDLVIEDIGLFENTTDLREKLNEYKNETPKIEGLTINLFDTDSKELIVYITTEGEFIGNKSNNYNLCMAAIDSERTICTQIDDKLEYLVIIPIFRNSTSGQQTKIGAYELIISMKREHDINNIRINNEVILFMIMITANSIIILFIFNIYLIKPLKKLGKTARKIGSGNLNVKAEIKTKDEIGDLAKDFNQMAADLKESRKKIEDYNKILKKLLEQKDEFIGQLGHYLKNPLQPLVGLLPMLIEQEKDAKIKETLIVMNQNVEYMSDLIFRTLELAKLRSTDIKFNFEKVNLKDEVNSIIKSQSLELKNQNVEIENKIKKDIFVKADKLRIVEVFKNLISNAVKYKKQGQGKISIDAKVENNFVKISVSDDGIGMTKDQLRMIFD